MCGRADVLMCERVDVYYFVKQKNTKEHYISMSAHQYVSTLFDKSNQFRTFECYKVTQASSLHVNLVESQINESRFTKI